jgi:FtsP/CotA-like multicopper oxidase with cupredoxin domain
MPNAIATRISAALAALILVFVGWQWWQSLVPSTYSAMEMGYPDFGGGEEFAHGGAAGDGHEHLTHAAAGGAAPIPTRDVSDLHGDVTGPADVTVELAAREETTTLEDGTAYEGYTLNGSTPGPTIQVTVGDVVEVTFRNDNVADGATLHWHGLDVPNAMDGVAGVTQDSVGPGEEFVYRFVADEVGSYWYHSHQVSHRQVVRGLFGGLVVLPPGAAARRAVEDGRDVTALVHTYAGSTTVNGMSDVWRTSAPVGSRVRVRVVNTDNTPLSLWVPGQPFRLLATDGHEVNRPDEVRDVAVVLGAGARADLEVVVPEGGARIQMGGTSIVVGDGEPAEGERPDAEMDFLAYGASSSEDDVLEEAARTDGFDRDFEYDIGRRPGFVDGKPGLWWSINGHLFPDVPMYMVREGDLVRMTISNHSGKVHPMHLHGHRITVLARDGEPVTGSSWQADSLNVENGESYEVGFVADNPGVWMDHCHNLAHAKDGMVAHLMYEGVSTDFVVGGDAHNHPE